MSTHGSFLVSAEVNLTVPSGRRANPKRPGAPVLSPFVFLDTPAFSFVGIAVQLPLEPAFTMAGIRTDAIRQIGVSEVTFYRWRRHAEGSMGDADGVRITIRRAEHGAQRWTLTDQRK